MSLKTMTEIAGLSLGPQGSVLRSLRALLGMLIAATGLWLLLSHVLPASLAAIEHIMASPLKMEAIKLATIAGAATGLGGLALLVIRKIDDKGLGLFIAIAAGMMAAAAVISLFLPAVQTEGALALALVAVVAGYGLMSILDQTLPHEHPVAGPVQQAGPQRVRMVSLMVIAIGLHNLPEGFAVGASAGAGQGAAASTAFSIGLQNIPEGLIVATALWSIGVRKLWAASLALATGLVEPIGAGLGVLTAEVWSMGTPASMAFAAGAMMFVVSNEMIPESLKMTSKITTLYATGLSTVATALALGWLGA